MKEAVTIYLEPNLRKSAEAGQHNFIGKVEDVLRASGAHVIFADEETRHEHRAGRALVHMKAPMDERTLVFRRVYAYPFWAIEASDKRWEWDVALATFDASSISEEKAQRFVANWRKRLFGEAEAQKGDYVYVALQGRISDRRSFQAMSPLEMIGAVLAAEPHRKIVIGLHPKENYSDADLAALERVEKDHSRVALVMGQMELYLPGCDYVVTQNSAVAFFGYFFAKPAALFGRVDFHHIAASAHELGAPEALRAACGMTPDFERYIFWFWQQRAINAGRPEAEAQIKARFKRYGWLN